MCRVSVLHPECLFEIPFQLCVSFVDGHGAGFRFDVVRKCYTQVGQVCTADSQFLVRGDHLARCGERVDTLYLIDLSQNDTMKQSIKRLDLTQETFTEERCHIIELSNSSDDPDCSVARARVESGVTTCWHRLAGTAERYLIISGKGRVEIGERPAETVEAGDLVFIPPTTRQRISNTGAEDLIFYAICTPRFLAENYQHLESDESFARSLNGRVE